MQTPFRPEYQIPEPYVALTPRHVLFEKPLPTSVITSSPAGAHWIKYVADLACCKSTVCVVTHHAPRQKGLRGYEFGGFYYPSAPAPILIRCALCGERHMAHVTLGTVRKRIKMGASNDSRLEPTGGADPAA